MINRIIIPLCFIFFSFSLFAIDLSLLSDSELEQINGIYEIIPGINFNIESEFSWGNSKWQSLSNTVVDIPGQLFGFVGYFGRVESIEKIEDGYRIIVNTPDRIYAARLYFPDPYTLKYFNEFGETWHVLYKVNGPGELYPISTDYNSSGTCIDGPLRIREYISTSSKIIGKLNTNDDFIIISRTQRKYTVSAYDDYWYEIIFGDLKGWVFGAFIEE